ncbi:MAG: HAD family phosphatase [bacterium]|nr:HAD family phosphatase [bacterium]
MFDLGGVILSRGLWSFRKYLVEKYKVTDEETKNIFIKKYYKPYFTGKISENNFWSGVLHDLNIFADWKELKKILLDFYVPNEGMFELIDELKNKGYKIYLLSDQTNDWWPILSKKYSIAKHFDQVFISSEVRAHKPEKEFYSFVLKELQLIPEEIIFVDDLQENLDPAKEMGINTLLYENNQSLKEDLEDI